MRSQIDGPSEVICTSAGTLKPSLRPHPLPPSLTRSPFPPTASSASSSSSSSSRNVLQRSSPAGSPAPAAPATCDGWTEASGWIVATRLALGPARRCAPWSHILGYAGTPEAHSLIGTAEEVAEGLATLQDVGVAYVLLFGQGSRDNLRRFAERVMPKFGAPPAT